MKFKKIMAGALSAVVAAASLPALASAEAVEEGVFILAFSDADWKATILGSDNDTITAADYETTAKCDGNGTYTVSVDLSNVTVRIPLPEECDESDTYYVYYQADDGTLTDMHAAYENGYIVFTTNHFSTYILSTEKLVDDSANDEDRNMSTGVIIAFIPALAAAAGVLISKKASNKLAE